MKEFFYKEGSEIMSDMHKKMCIHQGYVPSTCTLDGTVAWLLVNAGKDPCKSCNGDREVCNERSRQ